MRIDAHHAFSERYPLDHLASILKRNRFDGSVLVVPAAQADVPVPEFVRAVVICTGRIDPVCLDHYQGQPKFRGVCLDLRAGIAEGLGELESRGLTLDALGGLSFIPEIATRFPSLRIVLDHGGQFFDTPAGDWPDQLGRAAQFPQVCCKLSGLTRLVVPPRLLVRHALAAFGPARVMFGSDWPACLPAATWKAALAAFTQAIGAQPMEVREELLGGAAERFYAL